MSQIPLYVYPLFALLLIVGVTLCFRRSVRIERLLLMPAVFGIYCFWSYFGMFPVDPTALAAGGLALLVGFAVGYRHASGWSVVIDRQARRVTVPGDAAMLWLILAIFAFKFALNYGELTGASWVRDAFVSPLAAAVSGGFSALTVGRTAPVLRRYLATDRGLAPLTAAER